MASVWGTILAGVGEEPAQEYRETREYRETFHRATSRSSDAVTRVALTVQQETIKCAVDVAAEFFLTSEDTVAIVTTRGMVVHLPPQEAHWFLLTSLRELRKQYGITEPTKLDN